MTAYPSKCFTIFWSLSDLDAWLMNSMCLVDSVSSRECVSIRHCVLPEDSWVRMKSPYLFVNNASSWPIENWHQSVQSVGINLASNDRFGRKVWTMCASRDLQEGSSWLGSVGRTNWKIERNNSRWCSVNIVHASCIHQIVSLYGSEWLAIS